MDLFCHQCMIHLTTDIHGILTSYFVMDVPSLGQILLELV